MQTRAGLLGLLLVALLGTPAVAQSPEPTFWYAPDVLAYQLPPRVGDIMLEPVTGIMLEPEFERELLVPFGKAPEDLRIEGAASPLAEDQTMRDLTYMAVRVDGVDARLVEDLLLERFIPPVDESLMPEVTLETREVDGRQIQVLEGDFGFVFAYPKGEVMFFAYASTQNIPLTIEDVLAELP